MPTEAIGNQVLSDALDEAIGRVQRGDTLAHGLASCPGLFPPSVIEVIAVAEESGQLSVELTRLGTDNEQELDRQLRMLVSLAEPALLFVMATIVGTIVIGMLLPVFDLWDAIQ
ncbi:MAG: type II secretion system F family protein [Phycisphaerales bacterium]